ncbi:MAG: lipopolysaccharide biosynthesis protein [Acidimicrobiales bacterium]
MSVAPEKNARAGTQTPVGIRWSLGPRAAVVFGATITGTAVRFVVQIVLIRWLGTAAFGSFVFARQWGELLAKLPDRGYVLGTVRFIPRYLAAHDHRRHHGLLRRAIFGTVRSAIALAAIAALIGFMLGHDTSLLVGFTLAIAISLAGLLRAALQGSHHYMSATVITELGQPLLMSVGFAVLYWVGQLSVLTALGTVFTAWLLISGFQAQLLRTVTPPAVLASDPKYEDEEWSRSTRQLFLAQLGIGVINISDVLIVGITVGTVEAGIYAIATRIAAIGRIANAAVESLVSPQIAGAANDVTNRRATIQRTIDSAIRISIWPSLAFAIVAIATAAPVLDFIGKDFAGGRDVLIILVIGNLADAVSGPSGHVVSLVGSERTYARIMLFNAFLLLAIGFPAGLIFGMVGVAVARTVVNVSWNAALFAVAKSKFDLWCLPSSRTLRFR